MRQIFFILLITFIAYSCKEKSKAGNEYTSAYVCPMHCKGSGSDKPGVCPVCEMDYVKNEEGNHDGHNHEGHNHDHDGHDHNHGDSADTTHQH